MPLMVMRFNLIRMGMGFFRMKMHPGQKKQVEDAEQEESMANFPQILSSKGSGEFFSSLHD